MEIIGNLQKMVLVVDGADEGLAQASTYRNSSDPLGATGGPIWDRDAFLLLLLLSQFYYTYPRAPM